MERKQTPAVASRRNKTRSLGQWRGRVRFRSNCIRREALDGVCLARETEHQVVGCAWFRIDSRRIPGGGGSRLAVDRAEKVAQRFFLGRTLHLRGRKGKKSASFVFCFSWKPAKDRTCGKVGIAGRAQDNNSSSFSSMIIFGYCLVENNQFIVRDREMECDISRRNRWHSFHRDRLCKSVNLRMFQSYFRTNTGRHTAVLLYPEPLRSRAYCVPSCRE